MKSRKASAGIRRQTPILTDRSEPSGPSTGLVATLCLIGRILGDRTIPPGQGVTT